MIKFFIFQNALFQVYLHQFQGLGFRVDGSGYYIWGLWSRLIAKLEGTRVQGNFTKLGFRVQGLGFKGSREKYKLENGREKNTIIIESDIDLDWS